MSQMVAQQQNSMGSAGSQEAVDEGGSLFLTFRVAGEVYGVGILATKEILEYGELTRVPMVPGFILGVINVRGSVVPVIDLALRLGREKGTRNKRTCIVIIEVECDGQVIDIGIVVDAVNEVLEIPADEIEPTPTFGAKIRADFIRGMGKVNEKFIILLDVERVLSIEELSMLGQAARSDNPAMDC